MRDEVGRLDSARPPCRFHAIRPIVAVSLVADAEPAVMPVGPAPFDCREGLRVRIDIVGRRALVSEMP